LTERGWVRRAPAAAMLELRWIFIFSTAFRSCCDWLSAQSRPVTLWLLRLVFDTAALRQLSSPPCKTFRELLYFGGGELFASKSMKPIQGYRLIKPEALCWRRPNHEQQH